MTGDGPLSGVPLFAGLSGLDLEALEGMLRTRRLKAGEAVFLAGDTGSSLFIIGSGRVRIGVNSVDGREKVLALPGPGDFFGELSLLDGQPRSADAVAVEDTSLYILQKEQFLAFLERRPGACLRVMAELSLRLRLADELVQDASFLDIPARLAKAILQIAADRGRLNGRGEMITPRMSQAVLAAMVGATRESVNKCLRRFERQGLLRLEGGSIAIRESAGLSRYACRGARTTGHPPGMKP